MKTTLLLTVSSYDYKLPKDKIYTSPKVICEVAAQFSRLALKAWNRCEDEKHEMVSDIAVAMNRILGRPDDCGSECDGQSVNFCVEKEEKLPKQYYCDIDIIFGMTEREGYTCTQNTREAKKRKITVKDKDQDEDEDEDEDDEDDDEDHEDDEYEDDEDDGDEDDDDEDDE